MKTKMIYLSHAITASKDRTQEQHCNEALNFAQDFRDFWTTPMLYVPAESEPFVSKAYRDGLLTVEQILAIDKKIIGEDCCGVIFYAPHGLYNSRGMTEEYNFTKQLGLPHLILDCFDPTPIHKFLKELTNERIGD